MKPKAKVIAAATDALGIPTATPPKATPTANPSGILCNVTAKTSKMLFL